MQPKPISRFGPVWRVTTVLSMLLALLAPIVGSPTSALAATINTAVFSGGSGTASVGGTLYARSGVALTLTVTTDTTTSCVAVSAPHSAISTTSTTSGNTKTWTFSGVGFSAASGADGVRTVTVSAGNGINPPGTNCTTQVATVSASYVVDNTGPVVTGALSQQSGQPINGAGWANTNVTVSWSATDAGSGVDSGPTPATASQTTPTAGETKTAEATDRVGNKTNGSLPNATSGKVTVKLDKSPPTLSPTVSGTAGDSGWYRSDVTVSWNCAETDSVQSGLKSCTGGGTTTLSAETAGTTLIGTAVDNADNTGSSLPITIKIDKTAPNAPTITTSPAPNAAGWNKGPVSFTVTSNGDAGAVKSGVASCASLPPLSGETAAGGTTVSATCADVAGNESAAGTRLVKIDTTAPTTIPTAPANWNNSDVAVSLQANDALSGVAGTFYRLNGGAQQSGASVAINAEGVNTLEFWSVDQAGNEEAHQTVEVKIDRTKPEINHTLSPEPANGWNNSPVTVTFACIDGGSGIASCTAGQLISAEGSQVVLGEAVDNAGNSAYDPATVNIDMTPPSITPFVDRAPDSGVWYNDDVTVTFECDDTLSGVAACEAAKTIGEGESQLVDGEASDAAGNSATSSPLLLSVDKTPPSLISSIGAQPNGNGWYNADVTIQWSCADDLSGLAGPCPAPSTVGGEGANLGASQTLYDLAGNARTTHAGGIKIDRTAPTTTAFVPDPLASGWYAGDVEVTLSTGPDLSGVAATYYQIGSGQPQTYGGPFTVSAKGVSTITFWSADRAGNVEDKAAPGHTVTVQIDGVPPKIIGSRSPDANGFGWNNTPVFVSFACEDAESGCAGWTAPLPLSDETSPSGVTVPGVAQDNAGNTSSTSVGPIKIDLTPPTLAGAPVTQDNAAGWYNGDVTIQWVGTDTRSGIDPASQPANSTIDGEGRSLTAGPATIADKAGNLSALTLSQPVKIDRKPPTISGAPTTQPVNGWYNGAVTVAFSCADPNLADGTAGSGVANCSDTKVLSGNGAAQSVASDVPSDYAGNSGAATTVSGINIDGQPPQTTAAESCTGKNGYCRGSKATVVLTAVDQAGLSGVKEIRYKVNGGPEKVAGGASVSLDVPLEAKSGLATVEFWAVDKAGNIEPAGGVSLKYDNLAPVVTHTRSVAPNANQWNNTDVTLAFSATDDAGGSGVDAASWVNQNVTVSSETAGQTVKATVEDMAGNEGNDSATIKIDKTKPTIGGTLSSTTPPSNGWYRTAVTISWSCADVGLVQSGVASCPAADVITAEGANQSRTGAVSDKAGNGSSATVSEINIDGTAPTITISGLQGSYTLGQAASLGCTATDNAGGSGVDGVCSISVSGGTASGVGSFTYTATAKDRAGNVATATGSYRVQYRFDGFAQPIDDPRLVSSGMSVFKGGSTVPVKFQLKSAAGQPVQAISLPQWLNPLKGGATTLAVDESLSSETPTTGTTYRWDSTAQQYIFNWGTKGMATGSVYAVGVKLDDGMTYYVNIALR